MKERLDATARLDERIREVGWKGLSPVELLSLLLVPGLGAKRAEKRALRILASEPPSELLRKSEAELVTAGFTVTAARAFLASLELVRRSRRRFWITGRSFTSSRSVFEYFRPLAEDLKQECFWVLLLDSKNRPLRIVEVSLGALDRSLVHPREVFRPAVREGAAAVLCVHNHPSGDPTPSREDVTITNRLAKTGEVLGIRLIDHVIIGAYRYVSFADTGLLKHGTG